MNLGGKVNMDSSSAYILGVSIIIAGYFIGNGIRNGLTCFNKGKVHTDETSMWDLLRMQDEDIRQSKLVKKEYLCKYLGLSKQQLDNFLKQYSDIPSINVNGETYYIREELSEWLKDLYNDK